MNTNGVVTMTLFNKAYIPWAINFHRNMRHHGIDNLVMISLDGESQAFADLHNLPSLSIHCVLNSCNLHQSASSALTRAPAESIHVKTSTLRALIDAGAHVLFVEMDTLIYKDPYLHPMIKSIFSKMEPDVAVSRLTSGGIGIIASNERTKLVFKIMEENGKKNGHDDQNLWNFMLANANDASVGKDMPHRLAWSTLDACLFAEILPLGQNHDACKVKQDEVYSHELASLTDAQKTERLTEFYVPESSAPVIAYVTGYTGSIDPHSMSLISKVSIPHPPLPGHSFFITNIKELKHRAHKAGWRPLHISVEGFNMTDAVDTALAGKRMKVYPQKFLPMVNNSATYNAVVWFDNKFDINEPAVSDVIQTFDSRVGVYMHKHPFLCCGADLELKESMYQNRYGAGKEMILRYMEEEVSLGYKIHGERHFQTGVIIYNMRNPDTLKVQNMWMEHIKRCGIQCQISFYFIAQRFPKSVDEFTANISP